jgi:2-oxoglutarate decarboxylase
LCLTLRGQLDTESLIGRGDISVEEAEHALKDFSNQLEHVFNEVRELERTPRALGGG